jgi:hypothetical protein
VALRQRREPQQERSLLSAESVEAQLQRPDLPAQVEARAA